MTTELRVRAGIAEYPYTVGDGLLNAVPEILPIVADRVAIIYDTGLPDWIVDAAAGSIEAAGIATIRLPVPPGEESKSMSTAERLAGAMAAAGMHRTDLVAGLGGGATTDLAGFVAAIYHRGVDFLSMPTTMLGMVDASIGGKTAVNIAEGKNLIGAFHQPDAVIADVSALASLPDAELRSGMAEVVKHGLIGDPGLLGQVSDDAGAIAERDPVVMESLVARAAAVKIGVVGEDATEQNVRAHLNYGHTLGHALETLGHAGRGPRLRHGEAVALGMMFAAHVAVRLGFEDLTKIHHDAVVAAGLPTDGAAVEFDLAFELMRRDKKYDRGVRFVVLEGLARPVVRTGIDEEILRDAYGDVR